MFGVAGYTQATITEGSTYTVCGSCAEGSECCTCVPRPGGGRGEAVAGVLCLEDTHGGPLQLYRGGKVVVWSLDGFAQATAPSDIHPPPSTLFETTLQVTRR